MLWYLQTNEDGVTGQEEENGDEDGVRPDVGGEKTKVEKEEGQAEVGAATAADNNGEEQNLVSLAMDAGASLESSSEA